MSQANKDQKDRVVAYYDQEAARYDELYTKPVDAQEFYPANAVRFEMILARLKELGVKRVLDIGCGSGQPLLGLLRAGFDARGFDFSPRMVESAQEALKRASQDPGRVSVGDLEKGETIPAGPFDAIVCTGVFPHNLDDNAAYGNLRDRLAPGGVALVEYRNALMSLFSLNRYCAPFFWETLLQGDQLPTALREATRSFLGAKFDTPVESVGRRRDIEYSDILARFHNPLTLPSEIAPHGLKVNRFRYYHWHAAPPHLEKTHREEFWASSLKLERSDDWRGMFLCSAYVAELTRG
jgi:SAM-dependent methyltransferase